MAPVLGRIHLDIIGKIRRLTKVIFAANGNEVNLNPTDDAGMAASGDVTFNLPIEDSSSHEITTNDSTQTLTNKSVDADNNTITNLEDDNIKAGAAIDATKIHDGTVDNTEFGYLDGVTSSIQTQINTDVQDLVDHEADLANPHAVTQTQVGLGNVDNTSDLDKPISLDTQTALDLKADDADLTLHENDTANPHTVTATQVGLSNVDNTSDADKPVSTATQTALDLKQDDVVTTRGDVIIGDVSGDAARLPIGTVDQILVSDGTDVAWQDNQGGLVDPMTTRGDIIVRDAANASARLGVGTNGQILKSDGTDISWDDLDASGVYNYVTNPYAQNDTSGHTTNVSSGSFTVAQTTTAAELPSTNEAAWKISGSGVTVGDSVQFATKRNIANSVKNVGTYQLKIVDINGSLSTDWEAQLYNVTDAVLVGSVSELAGTNTYDLDAMIQPDKEFAIRMIAKVASPAAVSLEVGLFEESMSIGSTTWPSYINDGITQDYTFSDTSTGFSIIRSYMIPYREGDIIKLKGQIVATVTSVSSAQAVVDGVTWKNVSGYFQPANGFSAGGGSGLIRVDNQRIVRQSDTPIGDYRIYFDAELDSWPTWATKGGGSLPTISDVKYENARAMMESNSGTTYTNNSVIVFEDVLKDKFSNYNNSTGIYTVPYDGDYKVSAHTGITASATWGIGVAVNGSRVKRGALTTNSYAQIDVELENLSAGDTISIVNASGNTRSLVADSEFNYLSIVKISDYSGRAAGLPYATEDTEGLVLGNKTIEAPLSDVLMSVSGTAYNLGQITLTEGTWVVHAQFYMTANGGASRTQAALCLNTTAAFSNQYSNIRPTGAVWSPDSIPTSRIITVESSTVLYAIGYISFSGGSVTSDASESTLIATRV